MAAPREEAMRAATSIADRTAALEKLRLAGRTSARARHKNRSKCQFTEKKQCRQGEDIELKWWRKCLKAGKWAEQRHAGRKRVTYRDARVQKYARELWERSAPKMREMSEETTRQCYPTPFATPSGRRQCYKRRSRSSHTTARRAQAAPRTKAKPGPASQKKRARKGPRTVPPVVTFPEELEEFAAASAWKMGTPEQQDLPPFFREVEDLDDLDADACTGGIVRQTATHVPSGATYTLLYTDSESCDGGNSAGVILKGRVLCKKNVVRMIRDSAIEAC